MNKIFTIFLISLFSLTCVSAIGNTIPVQIQVTNDSGNILTGTYEFTVNISNSNTCSPVLYSNITNFTTDNRGIVSYDLTVDLNFSEQYYLCYYRDGVLKQTKTIGTNPYSFRSNITDFLDILRSYEVANMTASNFFGNWNGSSLYIPYTGATTDVDLGANNLLINNSVFFVNSTSGNVGIGTTTPNATLDVNGNIHVNSSILSPTGTLTLGGTGGSNNEDLTLDFETTANWVNLDSSTGANFHVSKRINIADDILLSFSSLTSVPDAGFKWVTEGNDNLQLGVDTGDAQWSGYFSLVEASHLGNTNRSPSSTSAAPVFRVYSNDATEADDYIEMYHDQTLGILKSGTGVLGLSSTGGAVSVYVGTSPAIGFKSSFGRDESFIGVTDDGGNFLALTNYDLINKDHDHPVQTDPTLFIHSDTNPDDDNTEWLSLNHDKTNAFIGVGKGDLVLGTNFHLQNDSDKIYFGQAQDVSMEMNGTSFNILDEVSSIPLYFKSFLGYFFDGDVEVDGNLDVNGTSSFGDNNVNYANFASDGELTFNGTARTIRHLRVGAASWDHGVSAPTEGHDGPFVYLAFDSGVDDEVHYTVIVPYRWDNTTDVEFAVDWYYTGAQDNGTVNWAMEYKSIKEGEVVTGGSTTINQTSVGTHTTGQIVRTTFTTKILASDLEKHDTFALKLYRDVSEDTLGTDAKLLNTHFHFTQDSLGEPL